MTTASVDGATVVAVSVLIGLITSCLFFAYHGPGALELSLEESYGVIPVRHGVSGSGR